MRKEIQKPTVVQYHGNQWEFIHPSSIENDSVSEEYLDALKYLDDDDKTAEEKLKALISKHPFFIDAYNHVSIAFRNQNKFFESFLTAEKAYTMGKGCIPKDFDFAEDKLVWTCFENRPFLRACQFYGLELQSHKKYEEAIEIYNEILTLNEGDNQGIRYLLLETFFASKKYKQAAQFLKIYSDDFSIEFKFGQVALYILENKITQADKALQEAVRTNKFFVQEVIKDKHSKPKPYTLPGEPDLGEVIPTGSIQEAFEYWKRNAELYKTKEIIEYFKDRHKTLPEE